MNERLARIEPSLIRALGAYRTSDSLDVGIGEPSFAPDAAFFARAAERVARDGCRYTANAGDGELRAAIAAHYAYPGMLSAENVCITAGAQEAIFAAIFGLLDPVRDEILIVEPTFGAYAKVAAFAGVAVRTVTMDAADGFAFDIDRILGALQPQTRMLVVCSPSNPTARVLDDELGLKLAAGLSMREGPPVIVLYDEVYREIAFRDDACDFARLYSSTVAVNSLSKSHAMTGLRIGWAIASKHYIEPLTKAHIWATSCASTYGQWIAAEIFSRPQSLGEHLPRYVAKRNLAITALREARLEHYPVDGSFYVLVKPDNCPRSLDFAISLAERCKVIAIPGIAFGTGAEGLLRLSFAAADDVFAESVQRIAKHARQA